MSKIRDDKERTWADVRRLLNDLEADGYDPILITTSTAAANRLKQVQINVERADSGEQSEGSVDG